MSGKVLRISAFVIFGLAGIYLLRVDFGSKLETDVSTLLPRVETEEARLARRLISDEQGRVVYLEVTGFPTDVAVANDLEKLLQDHFLKDSLIDSIYRLQDRLNYDAFQWISDHRLELLFPRWLTEKQLLYERAAAQSDDFLEWAANAAVKDMDAFLASPPALELARPELLDPLLLTIGTLLRLKESGVESATGTEKKETEKSRYYWITLADSPLSPETQSALADLVQAVADALRQAEEGMSLRYGGLVKLAAASRTRIQSDIFKINGLSALGVLMISFLLLRKPWRLLWALPALGAGVVGAITISFLLFDRVNALVLVVGSILIGTAIDYAIHILFADKTETDFPTRKLVGLACLSTVAGFLILLFAELQLIRQMGVFVGAGLVCAYAVSLMTGRSRNPENGSALREIPGMGGPWPGALSGVFLIAGVYGLFGLNWEDTIRNLEAPDGRLVREDIELRKQFGSSGSGSLFLSTGGSYLDVLEKEAHFLNTVEDAYPATKGFGVSAILPTRAQFDNLVEWRPRLPSFFKALEQAFADAGYDSDGFGDFFPSSRVFAATPVEGDGRIAALIQIFSKKLKGPLAGIIGQQDGGYWSVSTLELPVDVAASYAVEQDHVVLFSQLNFLNETLDHHRETLLRFGLLAMGMVGLTVLLLFHWKKGIFIILYPVVGGACAVGISHLLFGTLNMFHLIGCFLGGAIALDYALFAIESYARNQNLPHSVWLSAGTTTVSFLALSFSAIPVVQSLGAMVTLLTCVTLLLLYSSQSFLCRILNNNASE